MEEKEIDLIGLLVFFKKNFLMIFFITLAIAIIIFSAMLISVFLPAEKSFCPNRYTAKSIVKINSSSSDSNGLSSLINSSNFGSVTGMLGLKSSGGNYNAAWAMELCKSRTVLDEISNTFNLVEIYAKDSKHPLVSTRTKILKQLTVEESSSSGLLTVEYTDIDKELAAQIVNKVVDILENYFLKIERKSNTENIDILIKKMKDKENEIKMLVQNLSNFQKENNILDPYIMSQEITKKAMNLRTAVNNKESQLEYLKENFSENSPEIVKQEIELEISKKMLSDLENGVGSASLPSLSEIPNLLVDYEEMKNYVDAQRKIYVVLMQEYEMLRLKLSGTSSTFQVIERAEIPLIKSGPRRSMICLISLFVGFFISIVIVVIKETSKDVRKKMKSFELQGDNK